MLKILLIIFTLPIATWSQCGDSQNFLSGKKTIKLATDNPLCSDTLQYILDSVTVSFCVNDIVKECRTLAPIKDKQSKKACLNILDTVNLNLQKRPDLTLLLFGGEEFAFRIAKKGRVRVSENSVVLDSLVLAEYIQNTRNSQCAPDGGTMGIGLFMLNGKLLFSEIKGWID